MKTNKTGRRNGLNGGRGSSNNAPVRRRPAATNLADEPVRQQRSAVTNGNRLFVDGDGNSAWSRRWKDLIAGHTSDMGGRALLSESEMSLIKRASAIEVELELAEGRLSRGEKVDLDVFSRTTAHLRRILESLGMKRVVLDLTPTIDEYANQVSDEGAAS